MEGGYWIVEVVVTEWISMVAFMDVSGDAV